MYNSLFLIKTCKADLKSAIDKWQAAASSGFPWLKKCSLSSLTNEASYLSCL